MRRSINNAIVLIVFLVIEIYRQIFVADFGDVGLFGSGNVFVLILHVCSCHVSVLRLYLAEL